ncbi:hypothetical protein GCM10010211_19800 [Streptomyces albospinus]|uniref:Uncharacterized protein n=1 Tax=Streptomyces albospinus TaxID=285515 RepID=A0ABQ2UW95_9ACTN|nr:hypothetical protein [Streptomyces albospinus]GGU55159.1 hypothetical protein GCM10010211_19800 [Streptomyces albospinus]
MHDHDTAPDLASFAIALADELPGNWTSEHQTHTQYPDQFARAEHVWDMNLLAHAIAEHVLDQDAVLTRDDGARLYVIARPRSGEEFLVGAVAPADIPAEAFRAVREPDGIAVPDDPAQAAADITTDLLPRYDKALAQVHDHAARLTPAAPPELVVITLAGRDFHVTKPERADAAQILADNGCVYDPDQDAFVLSGKDTAAQAQAIQRAAAQLDRLGIGVSVRLPQAKPALETAPVTATSKSPARRR